MDPIIANATLTKIEGGGGAEDYDAPAGAPVSKWAGQSNAFYRIKRRMTPMGERVAEEYLLVDANLADIAEGDLVTLDYDNLTFTRTVHDVRDESWGPVVVCQELLVT